MNRFVVSAVLLVALVISGCGRATRGAADAAAGAATSISEGASDDGSTCDTSVAKDLAYATRDGVDAKLLSLDIYPVPGRCDAPVAVWVHGGGWQIGDKKNDAAQRAAFYNDAGWVLVAVNYRLSTEDADPPVRYPDHNVDVAAALGWVHTNVADHGGDPERTLLVGHSAGAGIVAAVVANPEYLAAHDLVPDWLDCAVLLDTAGYEVATDSGDTDSEIYRNAFGADPKVWQDASPISHVGDGALPERVLVVTRGQADRRTEAQAFADLLLANQVDAELFDASPLSHEDVNKLIGDPDDTVMTPQITTELDRCAG